MSIVIRKIIQNIYDIFYFGRCLFYAEYEVLIMRICMMIALIMIGSHIQMLWYYWAVLCMDFAVMLCRVIYEVGKKNGKTE